MPTISDGDVYTTENNDIITFNGSDGDSAKIIVNSNVYTLLIDGSSLCWYDRDGELACTLDAGDSETFSDLRMTSYNLNGWTTTFVSLLGNAFTFNVVIDSPACISVVTPDTYIPTEWQNYIASPLNEINEVVPPKNWSDFNSDHQYWEGLWKMAYNGLICWTEVPDEPKIEDYTA